MPTRETAALEAETLTFSTGTTSPRVLCVDDDPDISRTIELRLSNFEIEVLRAFHGMHGLWLAVTETPDVIITDLRMPQGEGEFLVECLKRNDKTAHIPVIVLTGLRAGDLPGRLRHRGAASFLQKPIHYQDLVRELSKHVDLRERTWDGAEE